MKHLALLLPALVTGCVFEDNVGDSGPHIQPRWVLPLGGVWQDHAQSVAIDTAGDVIVAGLFRHEMDFGGGVITSPQPERCCTQYYPSGFVTKRSGRDGAHQWTVTLEGGSDAEISAVATDAERSVYVTGTISDPINGPRMVTIALDPDGNERWRKVLASGSSGGAIAVSPDGTSYVVGTLTGPLVEGDGSSQTVDYGGTLQSALFVYDKHGVQLWARAFPGDGAIIAIARAPDGDLILGGYIEGTLSVGNVDVVAVGRADAVLARLDPLGAVEWAQLIMSTAPGTMSAPDLTVTNDGTIAMTAFESWDDGSNQNLTTRTFSSSGSPLASSVVKDAFGTRPVLTPADGLVVGGNINAFSADFGAGETRGRFYIARFDHDAQPHGAVSYSPIVEGPPQAGTFEAIDATSQGLAVAGWFQGPLDLGTGPMDSDYLDEDIIIAMYDWEQP